MNEAIKAVVFQPPPEPLYSYPYADHVWSMQYEHTQPLVGIDNGFTGAA